MQSIDFIYRFDPANPEARPLPATAEEARELLENGNRLFARWTETCQGDRGGATAYVVQCSPQDLGFARPDGRAAKHAPFATLLSCADARVPVEMIFGQVRNNLFVVRVAGNVLSDECLGSVEFAVTNLADSMRVVVVLGHTGCGAVTAAVDTYLKPWDYLAKTGSYALRSIVDRIFVPVRKAAAALEPAWGPAAAGTPGYRDALVEAAVFVNAAQTAYNLRGSLEQQGVKGVQVVYGVFDLLTHRVSSLPQRRPEAAGREVKLAEAPPTLVAFEELTARVAAGLAPLRPGGR